MENLETVSNSQLIPSSRMPTVVTHTDTHNESTVIIYEHTGVYIHERQ